MKGGVKSTFSSMFPCEPSPRGQLLLRARLKRGQRLELHHVFLEIGYWSEFFAKKISALLLGSLSKFLGIPCVIVFAMPSSSEPSCPPCQGEVLAPFDWWENYGSGIGEAAPRVLVELWSGLGLGFSAPFENLSF